MRCPLVGRVVEHAGHDGAGLGPIFDHRRGGQRVVRDGGEAAIAGRAHGDALLGARAPADRAEHLRPLQHQLDGPPHLARGHRRQHHMRPHRALAAEPAAHERAHHTEFVRRQAKRLGDGAAHTRDVLRAVVQRERIALPHRDGRVGLHGVVRFHGRTVDGLDALRCLRHAGNHVAACGIGRLPLHLAGRVRIGAGGFEIEPRRLLRNLHAHHARCGLRMFQRVAHHQRDGLAVVMHLIVLQQRQHAPGRRFQRGLATVGQARCALMRHHQQHAGHGLRDMGIDPRDPTGRHGALHQHGMHETRHLELR